jgi:uncharacterized repeat protein (TIGR03803 family)
MARPAPAVHRTAESSSSWTAAGKETVLYSFTGGADGGFPYGGLFRTSAGNALRHDFRGRHYDRQLLPLRLRRSVPGECGRHGKCPVQLHRQSGRGEPLCGSNPDSAGNLYGTTFTGGAGACTNGCGAVFKLDTAGTETCCTAFMGYPTDGAFPYAGVVRDYRPATSMARPRMAERRTTEWCSR